MNDRYFLDTNILVYAHDRDHLRKKKIAEKIIFQGLLSQNVVLSVQVLNEFFVTITKKIKIVLSPSSARKEIELLKQLDLVAMDFEMILKAIDYHLKFTISYWDALIVAAAESGKCNILYTEDLNHGQIIGKVKIVNPFKDSK